MILRLQSEEELELLQSRIKAKSTSIKGHMNGLERGTLLKEEIQAKAREQAALAAQEGAKTRQDRRGATFEHQLLAPQVGSSLEAEFLLQMDVMKLATPHVQYKVFPDRKFRLDFAWPDKKVAVLVQGNVHRIKEKFYRDCELFCLLTLAGWRYLPITRRQVKSLEGMSWIKRLLSAEP